MLGVVDDVPTDMHHTIPKGIQRRLRDANNPAGAHPDIIGRPNLPNRKPWPRDVHQAAHSGRGYTGKDADGIGGGHYNNAFHRMIESRGGYEIVSKEEVLEIRGFLERWFGP